MAQTALVISIIFPIASLIASVWLAVWLDRRRQRQANEELQVVRNQIQAETEARQQQQRALVTVHQSVTVVRGSPNNWYELTLTNAGPAPALYVNVTLVEEESHIEVVPSQLVGDIMPTHSTIIRFDVPRAFADNPVPVVVLVGWTDFAGTHRERKGASMFF